MSHARAPIQPSPPVGIIEGFFGRSWPWSARTAYATFLAESGFDFYLYAPKSDAYLRRHWQTHWPQSEWEQLQQLSATYKAQGLRFGIGLSPLELYREPGPESRQQLKRKVLQLNDLKPDILCLLFDDMRGDLPQLAERQAELMQVAGETTSASQLILCPTYYSLDPVLEKVFGARPTNYWHILGQALPAEVDIFWTGPSVCSTEYPKDHLSQVSEWLGRKPFLWDNYPVNDGAAKSKQLPLMAYPKGHSQLGGQVTGHAVNPMNQPTLSQIPLSTLPQAYRFGDQYQPKQAFEQACYRYCSPELAQQLIQDQVKFQEQGLDHLSERERLTLLERYQPFAAEPQASEVIDWLSGLYAFDPACLTD